MLPHLESASCFRTPSKRETWCFCLLLYVCLFTLLQSTCFDTVQAIRRTDVKVQLSVLGWSQMKVCPALPHPQDLLLLASIIFILQHAVIIAPKSIHHSICLCGSLGYFWGAIDRSLQCRYFTSFIPLLCCYSVLWNLCSVVFKVS